MVHFPVLSFWPCVFFCHFDRAKRVEKSASSCRPLDSCNTLARDDRKGSLRVAEYVFPAFVIIKKSGLRFHVNTL